jgi:plasmid stabilization system protein ParE
VKLAYHPLVQCDVSGILRHYDRILPRLGDEFWSELTALIELLSAKPERFHFAERGLRRANMRRFPYHLLFRVKVNGVRVIVVRHNKRRPSYGIGRK